MNPNPGDLDDLLLRWEESRDSGRELTPQELCPEDDLKANELARRIDILRQMDAVWVGNTSDWTVATQRNRYASPPGYEITEEIGRGGMGVVYKARQVRLGRMVAIKMIHGHERATPKQRAHFEAEARSVARLQHPNIVQIFDIQEFMGAPFISMEWIDGCDLSMKRRQTTITPTDAARLVAIVARAVHHAHERGIVHRDLKPANILLAGPILAPVSECLVKLTDFGIAFAFADEVVASTTDAGRGSPSYLAPEQAREDRKQAVLPTVDIHGLGGVLYELLTGRAPFLGASRFEILHQVIHESPPAVKALAPTVPTELADICQRALAKKPADRFATAADMADALSRFLGDPLPTNAISPGFGRRVWIAASLAGIAGIGTWALSQWNGSRSTPIPPAPPAPAGEPVKVGVLFSQRGPNQATELLLGDTVRLTAESINAEGGVLGRPLEIVWRDPESSASKYAALAEEMILEDKVSVIVGCFRSEDRRAVLPIVEKHHHLLIYPAVFEGLEESHHIFYTGSLPNQRLIPAIKWARSFLNAPKFFLLGSESCWSRAMAAIARPEIEAIGASVAGEEYIEQDGDLAGRAVEAIEKAQPNVVLSTTGGAAMVAYLRACRRRQPSPLATPHVFLVHEGQEIREITHDDKREKIFFATNYVPDLKNEANTEFRELIARSLGNHRFTTDSMESTFVGLKFWADAATKAKTFDTTSVLRDLADLSLEAPSGLLRVDSSNRCLWQYGRIGHLRPDRGTVIDYFNPEPMQPIMFPPSRSREEWLQAMEEWTRPANVE